MFQMRKEYCKRKKAYKYTKLHNGSSSVRLNRQYRLLFRWETDPTSSDKWSRNATNDKYLKATVVSSDRQNN